ncbi:hypothetical protein [Desulforamulus ruminis]|uniref:hypothetical protein n=1 Tax=Desulforamulus ruminis TaxID=1564 RepID=UPI0023530FF5|nr:hypothetical protein [Desulforamulus ruminis]
MKKALINPYEVKMINSNVADEPVPGVQVSFYVNNELSTAYVSDQFLTISRREIDRVVLGKLKYLLFKAPNRDLTKTIYILTDSIPQIDFWPKVTNGELELWKAYKKVSLYHSPETIQDHLLKCLFEQEKYEPGMAISVANLAAKMNTGRDVLKSEIQTLEEIEMIQRSGEKFFVHASDWIKLTQAGDRYVDENLIIGGMKVKLTK